MQQIGFLIAKLVFSSTCFGHLYALHQELKIYADGCLWYLAVWFAVEQHPANRTHNLQLHTRPTTCKPKRHAPQAATICITLEVLIVVPETC